ncbi:hypothetical protein [Streptomyces sp. NPDC093149]|uniref:hypothetical protein n=1 Tax=Streptomyces sp. NPDC093149 TaxID=3366031 RepID=UPI00382E62CE
MDLCGVLASGTSGQVTKCPVVPNEQQLVNRTSTDGCPRLADLGSPVVTGTPPCTRDMRFQDGDWW